MANSSPKLYEVNLDPFKKYPKSYERYMALNKIFDKGPLTMKEHLERLNLLEGVLKKEATWWDGHWIYASEAFIVGSSMPNPTDDPEVRATLAKGHSYTKKCLSSQPDNSLCKFFNASLLAKIASIDGIFASLKHGKEIRDAWQDIIEKGDYQFQFRPNVSLLGSAYYGLGLFYRLVPDSVFIDWLWGIRGNKEKSISYHKKAAEYDQGNPCSMLMHAVAILCYHGDDKNAPTTKQAMKIFDDIQKITAIDIPQELCQKDSRRIRQRTDRVCGYTQAKYEEAQSSH